MMSALKTHNEYLFAHDLTPYGEVLESAGSGSSAYGYTGEWTDSYIKLIYLRSRWYSPYLNRWIQPDTIIPDQYNPADWDRFSYARNNPIKFNDPSGHSVDCAMGEEDCEAGEYVEPGTNNDAEPPEIDDVFHPAGLNADYYSVSVSHSILGWLLGGVLLATGMIEPTPAGETVAVAVGALVNGGVTFTIDRYGRLYVSPTVSVGLNSVDVFPTVAVIQGNLVTGSNTGLPMMEGGSPEEIDKLLRELSFTSSASYAFFPSVGTTYSASAPYNAIEFGFGAPGNINFVTASWGFGPYQVIGK
jgi:RHS repeat-associated protein